jgi:hypothetical protein
MPRQGYQTITVRERVYKKLMDAYQIKKRDLIVEDIKSYTGYAQKLIENGIERDILASQEGRFEIIERYDNKLMVRDHYRVKYAEVAIRGGRLYCSLDETGDCDHVGFVLSDPDVIRRAKELGVKLRK